MQASNEMGFLIISEGGDGLGLATRLQDEGHPVSMFIKDGVLSCRGENLVPKGERVEFQPVMVADCTGSGIILDQYRDSGVPTFGGSSFADRLETDRKFASSIFRECKIRQPKSRKFSSFQDAKAFILEQDEADRIVFKPEGSNSGNIPSYVSDDRDDMLRMLNFYEKKLGSEAEFVIQEFIKGVAVSSEGWYARDHFVMPFNHTLERKQSWNDDLGSSGGCSGNVVWACGDNGCPLCMGLYKLEHILAENLYCGPIDINAVVSEDGEPYALEFTPRFGYDAFPTLLYGLFDGDFGRFIRECATGDASGDMPLRDGYAAGVRLSLPPWPSEEFNTQGDVYVGLDKSDLSEGRFFPYELSFNKDTKEFRTSKGVGIVGVAVGYGDSVEGAFDEAYRFLKRLKLPNKQYRTDLISVFQKDLRYLSRHLTSEIKA